jgi:gas vesicle protein
MPSPQEYLNEISAALSSLMPADNGQPGARNAQLEAFAKMARAAALGLVSSLEKPSEPAAPKRPSGSPFGVNWGNAFGQPSSSATVTPARTTPTELVTNAGLLLLNALASFEREEQVPQHERRIEELSGPLLALVQEQKGKLQARLKQCSDDVASFGRLNQEIRAREEEKKRLEAANADASSRLQKLRAEVEVLSAQEKEQLGEARRIEGDLARMKEQLQSLEAKRRELKRVTDEVAVCEKEVAELEGRATELQGLAHSLRERRDTAKRLVESLASLADGKVAERIRKMWQELPQDAFDAMH